MRNLKFRLLQNALLAATTLVLVFAPTFLSASAEKKGSVPENRESSLSEVNKKAGKAAELDDKKGDKKSTAKKKVVRKAGAAAAVGAAGTKARSSVKKPVDKGVE